jgi:membrane-bound lytic murein transglycosylase F
MGFISLLVAGSGVGRRLRRAWHRAWRLAAALLGAAVLLGACGGHQQPLPPPQQSGELVVASRQSPTTVYRDAEGQLAGPDFDLVTAFAGSLGVKVRWVWVERERQMYEQLDRGQAHLAAAALSPSEPAVALALRLALLLAPPDGRDAQPRRTDAVPRLAVGRSARLGGCRHAGRAPARGTAAPGGAVRPGDPATAVDALHRVEEGALDYAVVDTLLLARMRHWLIDEQAFELPGPRPVAVGLPALRQRGPVERCRGVSGARPRRRFAGGPP